MLVRVKGGRRWKVGRGEEEKGGSRDRSGPGSGLCGDDDGEGYRAWLGL
jgi:hypothetical protein